MTILPSTRAPGTTSCIRFSDRRKVDLPQPDGPISAVVGRAGVVIVMSSAALKSPEWLFRSERSRLLAMVGAFVGLAVGGSGEETAQQARQQVERHHDDDQHERG